MAHVYNPTKGIYVKGTKSNIRIAKYPKTEKDKKIDADSKYRRMVYKAIGAGIESGLTIEEAIKKVIERKSVVEHFSYMRENGINIEEFFKNLYIQLEQNEKRNNNINLGR